MAAMRVARLMDRLRLVVVEDYGRYWVRSETGMEVSELLSRIRLVLPDAERKAQSSEEIRRWTKEVDGVVQALEELFDEVSIITMETRRGNGKCSSLKLNCFTMKERLIARSKAKHITAELERLVVLAAEFRLEELSVMEHYHRVEDSLKEKRISQSVVGADRDKTRILNYLLLNSDNGLYVMAIVGRSGMGKSTLADLIFNDDSIQQHFDLKAWACVPKISSSQQVMYKIFTATTGRGGCCQPCLSLDRLLPLFHRRISGKRYLIVLDDVEFVDGGVWRHVESLLSGGSYARTTIIVTTSLLQVARTVAKGIYRIERSQYGDSWNLFEAKQEGRDLNPNMEDIARQMVEICNHNPLLIGILAALLFSNFSEHAWMSMKSSYDFLMEKGDLSSHVLILTLSYNDLPPHSQNCFASFSLFPTDYEFDKQSVIQYWMVRSFISSDTGTQTQSPEEIGDAIFSELARRFLFQMRATDFNSNTNTISFKLPSMVHDFSRHVARDECLLAEGTTSEIHHGIQHISFVVDSSWKAPSCLLGAKRLRSLLLLPSNPHERITELNLNDIFSDLTNLRHLDLAMVKCNSLPSSLREMKLLKYLALGTSTKSLPDSITVLRHLETLDLRACHQLRQLPDGFAKLYNLRHLRIRDRLIDMPPQFDSLQHLQTLDAFTVGENNGLEALARLKGLAGKLKIYYDKCYGKGASALKAGILKDTKLIDLSITWSSSSSSGEIDADKVLECLHPPSSLQILAIRGWKGVSFPNWGISDSPFFLPNLVSVHIVDCSRCQHLPALSRFPRLKSLQLWNLKALEYIESEMSPTGLHFPSLSCLELYELRQLKGWSRVEGDKDQIRRWHLPNLSCLRISGCPALMSIPLAPRVESIEAEDIHAKLLKHLLVAEEKPAATLQMLQIVSVQKLDSFIHLNLFPAIKSLTIRRCHQLIHLTADSQLPSLSHLDIESSSSLRDMSGALHHMSALKELGIKGCERLNLMQDDDGTTSGSDIRSSAVSAWQSLQNLHSLSLKDMAKLRSLPTGLGCLIMLEKLYICRLYNLRALPEQIQHLSQLRLLDIRHCPKLKSLPKGLGDLAKLQQLRLHHLPNWTGALPEWIGNLIDLRHLDISDCPNLMALTESMQRLVSLVILQISGCPLLTERCQKPSGDYWPLIHHIPHITIKAN